MNEDEKAQKDVEAFIRILEEKHGIEIESLKSALRFHDTLSRRSDVIANTIIRTIIVAALGGIGTLIYMGARHYIGIE